jgi:hypothetical protein
MLQIIIAIVVGIWFYRSARTVGKSGAAWAVGGILAFLAPSIPWAVFAQAVILPALYHSHTGSGGAIVVALGVGLVGLLLGLALVLWIHKKNLRPAT